MSGRASSYEIRYSTNLINNKSVWTSATQYVNNFVPREPGQKETIKVFGLTPSTTHYFAVRARDERGNLGPPGVTASATTTNSSDVRTTHGNVFVGPMGKRLVYEDGTAFQMIGHHISVSGTKINTCYNGPLGVTGANFYSENGGYRPAIDYLKSLKAEGKTTMRIFLEDLTLLEMGVSQEWAGVLEWPATTNGSGVNQKMVQFLRNLLDAAEKADIYIIVSMYDTFHYPSAFNLTPWSSVNGGPLSNRFQFYDAKFYEYHKARLKALAEVGRDYESLLAWEIGNEYDGTWAKGVPLSKRETWLKEMVSYVKTIDTIHEVISSSASWDFRRDAAVFPYEDNDTLSWLNLHMYPLSSRAPVRNPDKDKSIRPALEVNRNLKFHFCRMSRYRAITDGEFGPEDTYITSYSTNFTHEQEVQMTHNILWAEVAGGIAGVGLRGQGKILESYNGMLPDDMSKLYHTIAHYYDAKGINWSVFGGTTWDDNMSISASDKTLYVMGFSDAKQGTGWVLNDTRVDTGTVSGVVLTINALDSGQAYTIEFWDTYNTTATTPVSTTTTYSSDGTISATVPAFTRDIAVKFYKTDTAKIPVVEMMANNSGGPVSVIAGDTLTISISLSANDYSGSNADWWLVTGTPSGEFKHYDLSQGDFVSGLQATHQGALFDLGTYFVSIKTSGLATGTYTYYFGVDLKKNGSVDTGKLYYDSVVVNIQ